MTTEVTCLAFTAKGRSLSNGRRALAWRFLMRSRPCAYLCFWQSFVSKEPVSTRERILKSAGKLL